jgi:uncharacterized RDD family membrane protein YckC
LQPRIANDTQRFAAWVLDSTIASLAFTPLNPAIYTENPSSGFFLALWSAAMVLIFVFLSMFDGGPRGATPGKRIVGIRVVDEQTGTAIGYRRGALRRAAYLGGGLVVVGWLRVLWDQRNQAWHDRVARTLVVRTR